MSAAHIWTTMDGRRLDIRWMDSKHLVHSVNLIVRNNGLTRRSIESAALVNTNPLACMIAELKARSLWEWSTDTALAIPSREDFQTLCLMRAMIDTKFFWPSIVFWYVALICLRNDFETTWLSIQQALADPREHNRAKLERLVAKFTEYRLAPPVNGS